MGRLIAGFLALVLLAAGCSSGPVDGVPEDTLEQGWFYFQLLEYDLAAAGFMRTLAEDPPDADRLLQAHYGLGAVWSLRRPGENLQRARTHLEKVVELAPESDWAAWSLLEMARGRHLSVMGEPGLTDTARLGYQRVIDAFPGHLAGGEAFIYLMALDLMDPDEDRARDTLGRLQAFVDAQPGSPFVSRVWNLAARAHTILGQPEAALDAELHSLAARELHPEVFAELSHDYWRIATIAEFDCGDFGTARIFYRRFMDEYPRDQRTFGCRLALERMDRIEREILAGNLSAPALPEVRP
jgi:tetratricopeptide (TPR) repeat protein